MEPIPGIEFDVTFEEGKLKLMAELEIEDLLRKIASQTGTPWDDKILDLIYGKKESNG